MDKIPLSCVILAGGKSSRMGEDKALLPFGGYSSLTLYQYERLKNHFKSLHVSTKSKKKFDFEAFFIEDDESFGEYSPLVALYSVLKKLQEPLFFLSVDTPFVPLLVFEKLYEEYEENTDAIVARDKRGITHQLCALYSPKLLPKIENSLQKQRHKIRDILKEANTKYIDFENDDWFFNLNRKEHYEKAKEMIKW